MTRCGGGGRVFAALALIAVIVGCGHDRRIVLGGPVPIIDSISPSQGPAQGGTPITIVGSRFAAGAIVEVGGTPATSVIVVSDSEVTAVTPPGPPGPADVRVINPDATFAEEKDGFVFQGTPPQIVSVVPGQGPVIGGTGITLSGAGFQAGAIVTIGGVPASGVTVNPPSQILAITPPGPSGPADVTVINPDLLTDTLAGGFTYGTPAPAPTVISITPADGPTGGGTLVTVLGDNFQPGARIYLGGIPATSVGFVSATVLTGITAPGPLGIVDVVVQNPDGLSGVLPGGFEYAGRPIALFRIDPRAGDMAGFTPVTIEGAGFTVDTQVTIGGNPLQSPLLVDSFTITGETPPAAAPGKVDVAAANSLGSDVLPDGFTYTPGPPQFPVITALVPPQGPIATQVNIQGLLFGATPAENIVRFHGIVAPVLSASPTDLVAVVPPGATTGPVNVEVLLVPSNDVAFTVTSPRIRFLSPVSGLMGDPVTIIGENFSPNPAENEIRFHGTLATVIAATPTSLATTVPPDATSGPVTVKVTGEVTNGVPFCVAPPPPLAPVLAFTIPASGPAASQVTIVGSGFSLTPSNNLVRFNGVIANVLAAAATSLIVEVPARATTGLVTLNAGGREAPTGLPFIVTSAPPPAPSITSLSPETGAEGDGVYIEGTGFDPDPRNNRVEFAGVPAVVAAGSASWLLVTVPLTATGPVTVSVGGQTSAGVTFTITGPSAGTETVDFFGRILPVPSGRVIYLIDVSGTMAWTFGPFTDRFGNPVVGSRLDLVMDRVIASIQGLPSTVQFNVIAFDCNTFPWDAATQPATAANKAAAEAFVLALVPLGGTGTGPAVAEALQEREARTLLLPSDGRASCGAGGTEGHLCMILHENEQRAAIHTFGIDTAGDYRTFLEDIAAQTGGTYTNVVP